MFGLSVEIMLVFIALFRCLRRVRQLGLVHDHFKLSTDAGRGCSVRILKVIFSYEI